MRNWCAIYISTDMQVLVNRRLFMLLLGLRTRKTSFTLAFDLEPADLTDGLALPTSMPTSMSTEMPIDTGPVPTSKESATSATADRPFPLNKKDPFTATKTSGKVIYLVRPSR
ncbi:hypothetical protein Dimus_037635 [Dionaea muscipula]